jgi:TRAP-type C4-dicarboxylate transport system permease small subunit
MGDVTRQTASEASILRLFWWLWIVLFASMLIHFAWHMANPSWRPASSARSPMNVSPVLAI